VFSRDLRINILISFGKSWKSVISVTERGGICIFFLTIFFGHYVNLQAGYVKYATNSDFNRGSLP
jgi:hypothetical protein